MFYQFLFMHDGGRSVGLNEMELGILPSGFVEYAIVGE